MSSSGTQEKLPIDYRQLVYRGVESDELDYKSAMNWNRLPRAGRAKLVRHCLALANTKGGYIVIGVGEDESGHPSVYSGLTGEEAHSFDPSNVGPFINRHVEPPLDFTIERPYVDGKRYAIFVVRPFSGLPHVCANGVEEELQQGVFYIRTTDASSRPAIRAIELHALIQRALRNQRELLGRMLRGILYENRDPSVLPGSHFEDEIATARQYFAHRRPLKADELGCEISVTLASYDAERFGFSVLRRAAESASSFLPDDAFPAEGEIREAYCTNTALRAFPEKQQLLMQIGKSGLFFFSINLQAPQRELSYALLIRLCSRVMNFLGRLYAELGLAEELLELRFNLSRTEGLKLVEEPPPPPSPRRKNGKSNAAVPAQPAPQTAVGISRIADVKVRMRRSAADLASGREAHAARLIREIGERFNFPEITYRNLPRQIKSYLEKR